MSNPPTAPTETPSSSLHTTPNPTVSMQTLPKTQNNSDVRISIWSLAVSAISVLISIGSGIWSGIEAQGSRKSADRSADAAERTLELQVPSLRMSLQFSTKRPLFISHNVTENATSKLMIPVDIELDNNSIVPVGVRSISASWSGINYDTIDFSGGVNKDLEQKIGRKSAVKQIQFIHNWKNPLLGSDVSISIFKKIDGKLEQTEELPLLQAQQSLPLQAVINVSLLRDAPLSAMCPNENPPQNAKTRMPVEQCTNAEPWRYENIAIFQNLVAHATGGYNIFGRPAYVCEMSLLSSDVISLNVTVVLTSGRVCTMTAYPDVDGPSPFAECKQ